MKNLNEMVRNAQQGNEIAMRALHELKAEQIRGFAEHYAGNFEGELNVELLIATGHSAVEYAVETYSAATCINFEVHSFFMIRDFMHDMLLVESMSCVSEVAA